jgi:outer membrane protein TolC
LLLALAVAAAGLLVGCETPFADDADRVSYGLIARRQTQALGSPSDVQIDRGMIPVPVTPHTYAKVPATANKIPGPGELNVPEDATQPGSAGGAGPTTQQGEGAGTQPDPLAAILAQTPPLDLNNQPELPAFPRPTRPGTTRLVFTLDDAFDYALAHSRDYQLRKEDLYVAALNVALARHDFEPQFFATSGLTVTGSPGISVTTRPGATPGKIISIEKTDLSTALHATQTVGVRQRLPLGGQIIASGLVDAVEAIRNRAGDSSSASLLLQADIPLLRGAGQVAQENLIQTERSLIYEVRDFERFRRGFLVDIASSYFSLVNQRAQVLNRYRSVRSYVFITQRTAALFDAGVGRRRVSQLDLQRAQQSEFQARNDLINAIQQYELAVDGFKIQLGMPAEQPLDVATQYLTITPPTITEAAAVEIAERLRLDLQTVRDQVEDMRRRNKVAANALLPDLNVNAAVGTVSPSLVSGSNRASSFNPNTLDYSAGVTLDWPLDRVAERNAYRVSLINIQRAMRAVEEQEDQVAIDVRDSLRRVKQQEYLVSLQRSNIDLAVRRKEFADIQFKNGEIDNRDYLDAETALLDAQNRFAQSISQLQVSTLQYLRDTDQMRVDARGKLLVPGQAVTGVHEAAQTKPVQGTTVPAVPMGKSLNQVVPTTVPQVPDPSPSAPSTPP